MTSDALKILITTAFRFCKEVLELARAMEWVFK